jgi:hypothetical protein
MLIKNLANIKMKSLILVITIISSSGLIWGQLKTSFNLEYYNHLSEEANRKYPDSACNIIIRDSLNMKIFNSGKARIKMDTLSKWKLLFEYSTEEQFVGQELLIDSVSSKPPVKFFCAYDKSKEYSGKELFEGLEMDTTFLKDFVSTFLFRTYMHDYDSLKNFPNIFERDDPFNRVWMPIFSDDYLILRRVHSYPDGSQTSFYNEHILYFKRME